MTTGRVAGKVVIVTGGGRGLGRAMALGLAEAGARVIVTAAHRPGEIAAVADAANTRHGVDTVVPQLADVSKEGDCRRVVDHAIERFGRLDVLINNAALGMRSINEAYMTSPTPFWQIEPDRWRRLIDTNVTGAFLMARAVAPHLVERGWGRIVNVSTSTRSVRRGGFSPYGPSKAALDSATIIWAQDLAGTGVTVNTLLPGGASKTGILPATVPGSLRARLLEPEVMVAPARWLCSERSDGVTGTRFVASKWDAALDEDAAAAAAREDI